MLYQAGKTTNGVVILRNDSDEWFLLQRNYLRRLDSKTAQHLIAESNQSSLDILDKVRAWSADRRGQCQDSCILTSLDEFLDSLVETTHTETV